MLKFNAEKAEKQIGLLDFEQPYEFEKSFSFSGEEGSPLQHLSEILRIIREVYKEKK